jgi:hypothetical protein
VLKRSVEHSHERREAMNNYRVTFYNVDLSKASTWVDAYNDQHAIMVATYSIISETDVHPKCISEWIRDNQIHNVYAVLETN